MHDSNNFDMDSTRMGTSFGSGHSSIEDAAKEYSKPFENDSNTAGDLERAFIAGGKHIEKQSPFNLAQMEKRVKMALLWELIDEFQDAIDIGEDTETPKFSFNDIETELYSKMSKILTKEQ